MFDESKKGYLKLILIIAILLGILLFRKYICERVIINGQSMEPSFYADDICWANKTCRDYERYDVVVAKAPDDTYVIKRVVGIPGDKIIIEKGTVSINGQKIDKRYDFEIESDYVAEFSCDDNEYFLLGDNRNHSVDSRTYGVLDSSKIKGKVFFRFFPFNRIGRI